MKVLDKQLKPCPNCGALKYDYGFSVSEVLVESLGGIKEFQISKLPGLALIQEFIGYFRGFIRFVIHEIPETPSLVCKHCRMFVVVCPDCDTYFSVSARPITGDIIQCKTCKLSFGTSERSDDFDQLLGKSSILPWVKGLILIVIVGLIIYIIRKLLS